MLFWDWIQTHWTLRLRLDSWALALLTGRTRKCLRKQQPKHKLNYDVKARSSVLRPGDRVLVKNSGVRGKCKLADWWEKDPYIVIDQPNDDIPVYKVRREGTRSKTRFLHRNFLLPFMCLPYYDEEAEELVAPQEDRAVNMLDEMLSVDAISDLSSDPGSEAAYDGGISDSSSCPSPSKVSRYIIPMRRKPREPGLLPRITGFQPTSQSGMSTHFATSDEDWGPRPVRARRKPPWMQSNDWEFG